MSLRKFSLKNVQKINHLILARYLKSDRLPKPIHAFNLVKTEQYQSIKNEFCNLIEKKAPKYFFMDKQSINPFPILISKYCINQYKNIQEALSSAIQATVLNYFKDERIQSALKLDPIVKAILELYKDKSNYQIGSYRPDFLHAKDSFLPAICEINARFTSNAFFLTQYGCQALDESNYINNLKANIPIKKIENIDQVSSTFEKKFELKKVIGILLGREKCHDLTILQDSIKNTVFLKPTDLKHDRTSDKLYFLNENNVNTYIEQFIIELHQDEIVNMPNEILKCMVNSCKILNDLRTIFIVHNKRFMALMSDDTFLGDYLSKAHHDTIKQHRILSILPEKLGFEPSLYEKIIKQKQDWLLKPSLFGKGEGIIFGKNINESEWNQLIDKCLLNPSKFLIQKYLAQEKFSINHEERLDDYFMVGCLLCFDTKFLGPGIFRFSNNDLISLSQGGFFLYPVEGTSNYLDTQTSQKTETNPLEDMRATFISNKTNNTLNNFKEIKLPPDAVFKVPKISFEKASSYETSLFKYGIALLELDFEDSESKFFSELVKKIGIPLAHSSKNDDFLWHIKPAVGNELARSHSKKVFEMHTDASFEPTPPRYIGMQVIREDDFNGGQSLFLDLNDVINDLNEREIYLLQTTMLEFKKPLEFYKGGEKFTIGSILSSKRDPFNNILCRYRNDLILNRNEICSESKKALRKFEALINLNENKNIKYYFLRKNNILLLDNCRYLHGRTQINDPNRHLTRIRFQTKHEEFVPFFK